MQEWIKIRPFEGSQNRAFEELCCQLAHAEFIGKEISGWNFIRNGQQDGGVECFWLKDNGEMIGWQAKFLDKFNDCTITQIKKSLINALKNYPKLKEYYICLPIDLCDSKNRNCKTARDKWNTLVSSCKNSHPDCKLIYWGNYEIFKKLANSKNLYEYWFGSDSPDDWWNDFYLSNEVSGGSAEARFDYVILVFADFFDDIWKREDKINLLELLSKFKESSLIKVLNGRDFKLKKEKYGNYGAIFSILVNSKVDNISEDLIGLCQSIYDKTSLANKYSMYSSFMDGCINLRFVIDKINSGDNLADKINELAATYIGEKYDCVFHRISNTEIGFNSIKLILSADIIEEGKKLLTTESYRIAIKYFNEALMLDIEEKVKNEIKYFRHFAKAELYCENPEKYSHYNEEAIEDIKNNDFFKLNSLYELIRVINTGGMGIVYEVKRRGEIEHRALKSLKTNISPNEIFYRVHQHRELIKDLSKDSTLYFPKIFRITDNEKEFVKYGFFMEMEYIKDMVTLDNFIKTTNMLDTNVAVDLLAKICDAIIIAHNKGIFHGDLNPRNVFCKIEGDNIQIKVLDFELSGVVRSQGTLSGINFKNGTPKYSAPEVFESVIGRVGKISDVYSIGVIIEDLFSKITLDSKTKRQILRELAESCKEREQGKRPKDVKVIKRILESIRDTEITDSSGEKENGETVLSHLSSILSATLFALLIPVLIYFGLTYNQSRLPNYFGVIFSMFLVLVAITITWKAMYVGETPDERKLNYVCLSLLILFLCITVYFNKYWIFALGAGLSCTALNAMIIRQRMLDIPFVSSNLSSQIQWQGFGIVLCIIGGIISIFAGILDPSGKSETIYNYIIAFGVEVTIMIFSYRSSMDAYPELLSKMVRYRLKWEIGKADLATLIKKP